MAKYDQMGREIPDPKPLAMPPGLRVPESLQETMRRLIRTEMSRQAVEQGFESFEEADDFDVEEGEALLATPYELMPVQEERDYREPEPIPAAGSRGEPPPPQKELELAVRTPGVGPDVPPPGPRRVGKKGPHSVTTLCHTVRTDRSASGWHVSYSDARAGPTFQALTIRCPSRKLTMF